MKKTIVDSNMTFNEAIKKTKASSDVIANLTVVSVSYYDFNGLLRQGQLVVHKHLAQDVIEIFDEIKAKRFPIKSVIPIVKYGWDDLASMEDNNTSAFNYRTIANTTKLSNHSFGRAIDINPKINPYITKSFIQPKGATYDPGASGTLSDTSFVTKLFKSKGWSWGGDWASTKDYQHFEKLK